MKNIATAIFAVVALASIAPAQQPPVEISISGAYLSGELYTGLSGRINQLQNFLGTKKTLDINTFAVTNPRNGAPAAGFSLTYRGRIADNAFAYIGPAMRWEQGQKSVIGLSFGLLVTTPVPTGGDPQARSVYVWRRDELGNDIVTLARSKR